MGYTANDIRNICLLGHGGDGKSADFAPLQRYLTGDNIRLYCFGRDGGELAALRPEIAT